MHVPAHHLHVHRVLAQPVEVLTEQLQALPGAVLAARHLHIKRFRDDAVKRRWIEVLGKQTSHNGTTKQLQALPWAALPARLLHIA